MPKNLFTTKEGELLPNDPLNNIFEFLDPDTFFKVVKELRDYNKKYLLAHINMLLHWLKNSPVEQQLMSPPLFDNKALSLMLDHYLKQTKRQLGIEALSKRWGAGFKDMDLNGIEQRKMQYFGLQQIKIKYFGLQQIINCDSQSFHEYTKQKLVSDFYAPSFHLSDTEPKFAKLFQSNKLGIIKKRFSHSDTHFALTLNDTVYGWGKIAHIDYAIDYVIDFEPGPSDYFREPTLFKFLSHKGITDIVSNSFVTFVFTQDNKIYGWGDTKLSLDRIKQPILLENLMKKNIVKIIICFKQRAYFGLTAKKQLYSWGDVTHGQLLGHNKQSPIFEPTLIEELASEEIIDIISSSSDHIFVITKSGNVYGWGNNTHGELGLGILTPYISAPTRISTLNNVIEIVSSDLFWESDRKHIIFFALARSGEIYAWGRNSERYHIDPTNNNPVTSPIKLKLPTNSKIVKLRFKRGKFIVSTDKQEIIAFYENKWSILSSRFPITYHPDYLLLRYLALENEVFSLNEENNSQLENLLTCFTSNQRPENPKKAIAFLNEVTRSQQDIIDSLLGYNSFDQIKQLLKNQTTDLKDPIQNGLLKLIQTYIEGYQQTTFSFTFFKSDKYDVIDKLNKTLSKFDNLSSKNYLNLIQTFRLFVDARSYFGDEAESNYASIIDCATCIESSLKEDKQIHKPC